MSALIHDVSQSETPNKARPRIRHASISLVAPDIEKLFIQKKTENHTDVENYTGKENIIYINKKESINNFQINSILLRCFICGTRLDIHSFQCHYFLCKSQYNQKNSIKNKSINEPQNFGEFFNKIVVEVITVEEINEYNLFAEKYFWDVMCKNCTNCNKKFNLDGLEKHVRNCLIENNDKPIRVSRLKDKTKTSSEINVTLNNYDNEREVIKKMRKKSMDDIRNYDIKQIRNNVKHYFI